MNPRNEGRGVSHGQGRRHRDGRRPDRSRGHRKPAIQGKPVSVLRGASRRRAVAAVRTPDGRPTWLVTRYDDVVALLKDERFIKDRRIALTAEQAIRQPWIPAIFRPLERNMLDVNPPDHTRLRAGPQSVHAALDRGPAREGAGDHRRTD